MEYNIGDFIEFIWSRYIGVARILKKSHIKLGIEEYAWVYECYVYECYVYEEHAVDPRPVIFLADDGVLSLISKEIIRKLTKDESLILLLSE